MKRKACDIQLDEAINNSDFANKDSVTETQIILVNEARECKTTYIKSHP